jgi:predicted outer membrane protein
MSASLPLKATVLAAALSCLVAGPLTAQQRQQTPGERPRTDQIDRSATQQAQPGQPYTAQFRGTQAAAGQNQQLEHYLANCLLMKNQAEIEISQFASQQAQNPEVKQFAQQLVRDHQQTAQKLQALAGAPGAQRTSPATGAGGQFDAPRQQRNLDQPQSRTAQGQSQDANQALTADRSAGQHGALPDLLEIDRQITQRCTEMVREELQAKSGAEFDQCFLAAQIGNHMHMLAALEVIGQKAQGELQQVVQEAQPVVQKHLEHAKQLAKAQQSDSQTGAQAERQPGRTQR